ETLADRPVSAPESKTDGPVVELLDSRRVDGAEHRARLEAQFRELRVHEALERIAHVGSRERFAVVELDPVSDTDRPYVSCLVGDDLLGETIECQRELGVEDGQRLP